MREMPDHTEFPIGGGHPTMAGAERNGVSGRARNGTVEVAEWVGSEEKLNTEVNSKALYHTTASRRRA